MRVKFLPEFIRELSRDSKPIEKREVVCCDAAIDIISIAKTGTLAAKFPSWSASVYEARSLSFVRARTEIVKSAYKGGGILKIHGLRSQSLRAVIARRTQNFGS